MVFGNQCEFGVLPILILSEPKHRSLVVKSTLLDWPRLGEESRLRGWEVKGRFLHMFIFYIMMCRDFPTTWVYPDFALIACGKIK